MARRTARHRTASSIRNAGPSPEPLHRNKARRAGRRVPRRWGLKRLAFVGGVAVGLVVLSLLIVRSGQTPASPSQPASGDFTLVAYQGQDVLGGSEVDFSHVLKEGKPVVLNFFAGACTSCQEEMPGLQRVSDHFGDRVVFVGVDVGPFTGLGTHEDAAKLLKQLGIRYPAAYAVDATPLTLYVQGMPTTVVFDAKGRVVTKFTGTVAEAQMQQTLNSVLGS